LTIHYKKIYNRNDSIK